MKGRLLLLAILTLTSTFANAMIVLDQAQLRSGFGGVVGGSTKQRLAQTFKVGVDGTLAYVKLAVACDASVSTVVEVSIHSVDADGMPTGTALATNHTDSSVLPDTGDETLTAFPFTDPPPVTRGEQLAIVIDAPSDAVCEAFSSGFGDPYPNGSYLYQSGPNPMGWQIVGFGGDLTFETFVDNGVAPGLCQFQTAYGANNDWVPSDVPVCRCLEDRQLAQQRCAFMLPHAIVFSELPLNATSKLPARWSVEPLIDPGTPTTIDLQSVNGDLHGKTVAIHARKPMYSKTIHTTYQADTLKALDQTIVTIKLGDTAFRFESIRPPLK